MCHKTGSLESSCATSLENDHCISQDSFSACTISTCPDPREAFKPIHIHLAVAGSTGMRVSWKTNGAPTGACSVSLSPSHGSVVLEGKVQYLVGHGYHHHATLQGLSPGTDYTYQITCDGASSDPQVFHVAEAGADKANFLVVADMGTGSNGKALTSQDRMNKLVGSSDMTLHMGDIGYADDAFLHGACVGFFCYEAVYDQFFVQMKDVMASKPYMTMPGNHECECHSPNCIASNVHKESLRNFSAYNTRWHMPSKESGGVLNMWYSFDHGPVHFVAINTETDFDDAPEGESGGAGDIISDIVGLKAGHFGRDGEYLAWLEADLAKANANRHNVPFIVAGGHRTWIVKNAESKDPAVGKAHAALFEKYNVDLYLCGHIHAYSRHLPIDGNTATPVVVTGGAGCDEGLESGYDETSVRDHGWDSYWSSVFQVGSLEATKSSLTWKAIESSSGKVFDTFTLSPKAAVAVTV